MSIVLNVTLNELQTSNRIKAGLNMAKTHTWVNMTMPKYM